MLSQYQNRFCSLELTAEKSVACRMHSMRPNDKYFWMKVSMEAGRNCRCREHREWKIPSNQNPYMLCSVYAHNIDNNSHNNNSSYLYFSHFMMIWHLYFVKSIVNPFFIITQTPYTHIYFLTLSLTALCSQVFIGNLLIIIIWISCHLACIFMLQAFIYLACLWFFMFSKIYWRLIYT